MHGVRPGGASLLTPRPEFQEFPMPSRFFRLLVPGSLVLLTVWGACAHLTGPDAPTAAVARAAEIAAGDRTEAFPRELVDFVPAAENPVFEAEGSGHWDLKLRERGWVLREGTSYSLWYTGYDGTREGQKMLGLATSEDGLHWARAAANPLCRDQWVEDMMVVKQGATYYMFAEGRNDQAQLLTSADRVNWEPQGTLDVRSTNGKPLTAGPFGTPTGWYEDGTWFLFYERQDAGVWLATSKDLKIWTNVQDEPVLARGPEPYDKEQIALNQIVKHDGRYYAYYHGSGSTTKPALWTTSVATSTDLVHWTKYPKNPLQPETENKSSGILVNDGQQFRLYTMHDKVQVHFLRKK
jgi:hypothetical protein